MCHLAIAGLYVLADQVMDTAGREDAVSFERQCTRRDP